MAQEGYVFGRVTEMETNKPIYDAIIYQWNSKSEYVQVDVTDANGSFSFDSKRTKGQPISITIQKEPVYAVLNFNGVLPEAIGLALGELKLKPKNHKVTRLAGHIYQANKKKEKIPISHVHVHFIGKNQQRVVLLPTDDLGFFSFGTNITPGFYLDIYAYKEPDFKFTKESVRIDDPSIQKPIEIFMHKKINSTKTILIVGGALLSGSLITGVVHRIEINSYVNPSDKSKYNTANVLNKISFVSSIVGAIISGIGVKKWLSDKRNSKNSLSINPKRMKWSNPQLSTGQVSIGLSYNLNKS